jgi:hypothetical protein
MSAATNETPSFIQPNRFLEAFQEGMLIDWLCQKIDCTVLECPSTLGEIAMTCDENDRQDTLSGLQPFLHREAIKYRHSDVDHEAANFVSSEPSQELSRISVCNDIQFHRTNKQTQSVTDRSVVIDKIDSWLNSRRR